MIVLFNTYYTILVQIIKIQVSGIETIRYAVVYDNFPNNLYTNTRDNK